MLVVQQGVGVFSAEVKVDATDRHVHGCQTPGGRVRFLAVDGDLLLLFSSVVVLLARVLFNKAIAGHKEPAGAHRRVIHAAVIGLEHFDDQGHDAFWRVVLAALFAFCQRELTEEIFVNVTENIFALKAQLLAVIFRVAEVGVRESVNQPGQYLVAQLILTDTVKNAFQFRVGFFNFIQRVVHQPGDGAQLHLLPGGFIHPQHGAGWQHGFVFQRFPARGFRHPEDVLLGVVVFYFELIQQRLRVLFVTAVIVARNRIDVVRVADITK